MPRRRAIPCPCCSRLDAELVVGGASGERTIAAADFWPAYRRTAARADELLVRVRIPLAADRQQSILEGRHAAGPGDLEGRPRAGLAGGPRGEVWRGRPGRPGLGRRDADPGRRDRGHPRGQPTGAETADRAVAALIAELEPIDDVRSTAAYRREVAGRVLHRLLRDAGGW